MRKRRAAGKKATKTRKSTAAGKKAALTRKRNEAGRKAAATRKLKKEQSTSTPSSLQAPPPGSGEEFKVNFLFSPDNEPQFGREFCFLCGEQLPENRATDEHVFPKWMQERFALWDQTLTILNHTTIPYRQVTIPCCGVCNSKHLGKIEAQMQKACAAGKEAILDLAPETVFLWLGKIFFGLLYREHLLPWNRRTPEDAMIVPAEVLDQFRLHHRFLQAARVPFQFRPHLPASLFVFETLAPTDQQMQFDYADLLFDLAIAVRVGKVGLIACLQDGHAVRDAFDYSKYDDLPLHPIQFSEMSARIFYDLTRFNRTPKFMLAEFNGSIQVFLNPLGGLSGKPLFDRGNLDGYAKLLALTTRLPEEELHPEPERVVTWLHGPDGKIRSMDADDPI